jgi:hypothetical protein
MRYVRGVPAVRGVRGVGAGGCSVSAGVCAGAYWERMSFSAGDGCRFLGGWSALLSDSSIASLCFLLVTDQLLDFAD